jgi:tetratricopeptide (TPR) repeat protein
LPASSEEIEVWRVKARVLFARGSRDAMAALQKANKIDPKDAETFCEIGNAFVRQGGYDVAPAAFKAATDNDAKSACGLAGPLHARPVAKADKGKLLPRDLLLGLVNKSNHAWDKAYLQATLARVHLEERDLKSAQAMAKDATATAPAQPVAWFALGEVLHRQKNDDGALEAYQKAADLDGSWSAAHLALADLLQKQGGDALPRALAEYELVAQIDQNEVELGRAKKLAATLKKQLQK